MHLCYHDLNVLHEIQCLHVFLQQPGNYATITIHLFVTLRSSFDDFEITQYNQLCHNEIIDSVFMTWYVLVVQLTSIQFDDN